MVDQWGDMTIVILLGVPGYWFQNLGELCTKDVFFFLLFFQFFSRNFCDNLVSACFFLAGFRFQLPHNSPAKKVELLCRVRKDAGPVEVAQVGVAMTAHRRQDFAGFQDSKM